MIIKKQTLSIAVLSLVAIALVVTGTSVVFAQDAKTYGPNHTPEREVAMESAFESQDYATWKALMSNVKSKNGGTPRVLTVVNESNFAKFAQMHELEDQGKTAEAAAIRTELGLGQGKGMGKGQGGCQGGATGSCTHQGNGTSFTDANGNGVCDRME